MRRIGLGLLYAICAYPIAALAGYFLIEKLSSNIHDRSVEAIMTSAFAVGPLGAFFAFIVGFIRGSRT